MSKRILVCGAGSIGRRHIANLKALGAEPMLWRARTDLVDKARAELAVTCHADRAALMDRADAVVVATAPDSHTEIAMEALSRGLPLFIEKPLAHSREGVARVMEMAREGGAPVEIGCQLRYHPALQAMAARLADRPDGPVLTFRACVGQRLDHWRPGTDHRASFSADAARGGGALFELVHELDLVRWILGPVSGVQANLATVGDLGIRADDLANLTLTLDSGGIGQVQIDMLSPIYRRDLEIVCRDAIWRFDYVTGHATRHAGDAATTVAAPPDGFERNDLFLDHMRHFLCRIDDPGLPAGCGLEDGVDVLDYALAARASHAAGGVLVIP
jgi:predicted dehydrogenase